MPVTPELAQYVYQARQTGVSDDVIRQELLKAGWNPLDIDVVLSQAPSSPTPPAPSVQVPLGQEMPKTPPTLTPARKSHLPFFITVILLLIIGGAVYFFLPQIVGVVMRFQRELINSSSFKDVPSELSVPQVPPIGGQIDPITEVSEVVGDFRGYYTTYEKEAWEKHANCSALIVLSGHEGLIKYFNDMVERGNTVNRKDDMGHLVINLNMSSLNQEIKSLIASSTSKHPISIKLKKLRQEGMDAPACYSFFEVLSVSDEPDILNWKTYHNVKYGFEFKYPPLGIGQKVTSAEEVLYPSSTTVELWYKFEALTDFHTTLRFSVVRNQGSLPLHEWFEKNIDVGGLLVQNKSFELKPLPSGAEMYELTHVPLPPGYLDVGGPVAFAYLASPSRESVIGVDLSADGELDKYGYEGDKFIDQVLSTFKFIPQATSTKL